MTTREARVKDAEAICKLIHQLGYEISTAGVVDNIKIYGEQKAVVLVAVDDQNVIGFVSGAFVPMFHVKDKMFRITALCVDEAQRGKGIGKMLIHTIESSCQENDCTYLEVTSGAHREKDAHLFYLNLGYKVYEGRRFLKRLSANST